MAGLTAELSTAKMERVKERKEKKRKKRRQGVKNNVKKVKRGALLTCVLFSNTKLAYI